MSSPRVNQQSAAQVQNQAQQAHAHDRHHAHAPQQGQHQGRRWSVPPGPRAQPGPRRGGPPLTGRRQAARSTQTQGAQMEGHHDDGMALDKQDMDADEHDLGRRMREMSSGADAGANDHRGKQDSSAEQQLPLKSLLARLAQREGKDQGKKSSKISFKIGPKKLKPPPMSQRLNAIGVPGTRELFGVAQGQGASAGPLESLSALASVILSSARLAATKALPQMPLGRLVAGASAAFLRQAPAEGMALSLGQVRQLLLDRQRALGSAHRPAAALPAAVGDVYALLPLVILNASSRPRTPKQRAIAIDRQQALLGGQDL